jgi:hypothetical protein
MKLSNIFESLLNELYGEKVINTITKKFNDNSEDMINKLAIASLFRNIFGDISQYKDKVSFDNTYNNWYKTTVSNLIKTTSFIDNKDLAIKYLDAYINNIKSLGDKGLPFSYKTIESSLVDVVNNNRWVKDIKTSSNNIYEPKDTDILYEDNEIIILNTDSKAKCVIYGQGESWCITKPELNYYNTYRFSYGATPYFVLQKNVEGNEHKFVIMNYGNGDYAIADRSNSGDRSGGKANSMSWGKIEMALPNLKGKEEYFKYREISDEEKKYEDLINYTKGYKGNNLIGFIEHKIKGLIINGSEVTVNDFLRDYVASNGTITYAQLTTMDKTALDTLTEAGFFIRHYRDNLLKLKDILSPKQILRNIRLKIQNNITLSGDEIRVSPEDIQLLAVKREGNVIQYIDNPSELVQLEAVKQEGNAIRYIDNPTEQVKEAAVKGDGNAIRYIDNPSEQLQLEAVKQNGEIINDIKNPSEQVKLVAVKQTWTAIKHIDNPSEQLKLEAVKQSGFAIRFIDNPSEEVQLEAIKDTNNAIYYIDVENRTDKAIALHKELWMSN